MRAARLVSDFPIRCRCIMCIAVVYGWGHRRDIRLAEQFAKPAGRPLTALWLLGQLRWQCRGMILMLHWFILACPPTHTNYTSFGPASPWKVSSQLYMYQTSLQPRLTMPMQLTFGHTKSLHLKTVEHAMTSITVIRCSYNLMINRSVVVKFWQSVRIWTVCETTQKTGVSKVQTHITQYPETKVRPVEAVFVSLWSGSIWYWGKLPDPWQVHPWF